MAVRKKFINAELPMVNESLPVLGTPEELNKKTIKLDLSRKLKGRGLEATFLLLNKDDKLIGYPKNLTLMRSYIQRVMRKRVNYVEDSIQISCKDVSATIKPFLITRKKVSRAIRNNLRKTAREFLIEYAKTKTYLQLAESVIYGEIQKDMYPKLKKVYPLSLCEIRILETKQIEQADFTIIAEEETKVTQKAEEEVLDQAAEAEAALKAKATEKVEEEVLDQAAEIEKEKKSKKEE